MYLKSVILQNFRSYRERTTVPVGNLTTFVGKNEAGKSTILAALEIFFNSALIKPEKDDLSAGSESESFSIGCVFGYENEELVLDASATTNLRDEHLLNADGDLEILKRYNCSGKLKMETFANALHPTEFEKSLLLFKNTELKSEITNRGIEGLAKKSSNVSMRQALWAAAPKEGSMQEIPLDKDGAKEVYEQLVKFLPIYALFEADRTSRDDDDEAQDPMKLATLEAIRELQPELESIKNTIQKRVLDVANRTLDKLREINPKIAAQLTPDFKEEPKWSSIFKFILRGDQDIPLNKRGSGVRRLILISFFRAEAERRQSLENSPGIIYAIEEPETSQHPTNQRMLAEAFIALAESPGCQVLLTTHVPAFAGLLPVESLRLVEAEEAGTKTVTYRDDAILAKIAKSLGVLPDPDKPKLIVCVEGPNDIECLTRISRRLHTEDPSIPDISALRDSREVAIIPLGGGTLSQWVQQHYLKMFDVPELHIHDGGLTTPRKYATECAAVNARSDGSWATLTSKNELENYLHHDPINQVFGTSLSLIGDNDDVPMLTASEIHNSTGGTPWANLDDITKKDKESRAKRRLNKDVADRMNLAYLKEVDPSGELIGWLRKIASYPRP